MGVPKNYNETVNLKKRFEALNELEFHTYTFDVSYTDKYEKLLREAELNGNTMLIDFDVVSSTDKLSKTCVKRFSAVNEEDASRKILIWLQNKIEEEVIVDYKLKGVVSNTFHDELKEKGLLPLIDVDEFNKISVE